MSIGYVNLLELNVK